MQEVAIIAPLTPLNLGDTFPSGHLNLGDTFPSGQVPLHLTVLPNTRVAADVATVTSAVEPVAASFSPLDSVALGVERFGPEADVVVTEVLVTAGLRKLHEALREALAALGAEPVVEAYNGAGYRSHVTRTWQGVEITPGRPVHLDRIAVLDCSTPLRRVLSISPLSSAVGG